MLIDGFLNYKLVEMYNWWIFFTVIDITIDGFLNNHLVESTIDSLFNYHLVQSKIDGFLVSISKYSTVYSSFC